MVHKTLKLKIFGVKLRELTIEAHCGQAFQCENKTPEENITRLHTAGAVSSSCLEDATDDCFTAATLTRCV